MINRVTDNKFKLVSKYQPSGDQPQAIEQLVDNIEGGEKAQILMGATGTGKTRTSVSLVDVLSRSNQVTNVLFLADRIALVSQAKDAFREHLPSASLCNLCESKDDKNARIVLIPRKVRSNSEDNSPTISCKSFAIGLVFFPSNKPQIKRESTANKDTPNN